MNQEKRQPCELNKKNRFYSANFDKYRPSRRDVLKATE